MCESGVARSERICGLKRVLRIASRRKGRKSVTIVFVCVCVCICVRYNKTQSKCGPRVVRLGQQRSPGCCLAITPALFHPFKLFSFFCVLLAGVINVQSIVLFYLFVIYLILYI